MQPVNSSTQNKIRAGWCSCSEGKSPTLQKVKLKKREKIKRSVYTRVSMACIFVIFSSQIPYEA